MDEKEEENRIGVERKVREDGCLDKRGANPMGGSTLFLCCVIGRGRLGCGD